MVPVSPIESPTVNADVEIEEISADTEVELSVTVHTGVTFHTAPKLTVTELTAVPVVTVPPSSSPTMLVHPVPQVEDAA